MKRPGLTWIAGLSCAWWIAVGLVEPLGELPLGDDAELTDAIRAQCEHALHVIQSNDRVLKGADAVFFAYQVTGLPLALLRIPPLIWVAELGYRVIAANRYWFSKVLFTGDQGLNATCKVELQDPDSPS